MQLCFSLTSMVSSDAGTTGEFVGWSLRLACRHCCLPTQYPPLQQENPDLSRASVGLTMSTPLLGFCCSWGGHVAFSGR